MARLISKQPLFWLAWTVLLWSACQPAPFTVLPSPIKLTPSPTQAEATRLPVEATRTPIAAAPSETLSATPLPTESATPAATFTPQPTSTPTSTVPSFSHIIVIVLENKEFGSVIGKPSMPIFNQWAKEYTLLTQYYAIRHPSLPNYLAMIGGDTFGVTSNCRECYQSAPVLPDLIEASGRTWKAYLEDMREPCSTKDTLLYVQKHNPFMYFDSIRLDPQRCTRSVVPFTQLDADLAAGTLPDFVFIVPNQCNNSHDCPLHMTDLWLGKQVPYLLAYPEVAKDGLIVITWEEGQGEHSCCGLPTGGGRVALVLISSLARPGFQDDTPYTHYSLLKTISAAWGLEYLGHAADPETALIIAPWQK